MCWMQSRKRTVPLPNVCASGKFWEKEQVLDKDGIKKYKRKYEQAIKACHFAKVLLSPVLNQDEISVSQD